MPVGIEENAKYQAFVSRVAQEYGCFDFTPEQIVWHYTDAAGILGIIQSSAMYATQVAALNDAAETRHASELFLSATRRLIESRSSEDQVVKFLEGVAKYMSDYPALQARSKFFVTCFSGTEDDLSQWDRYGKPTGYAIGFFARGLIREPNSTLYRVVYDASRQGKAAEELVEATVRFYFEGLTGERLSDPEQWGKDFVAAWDNWIYKLAPLAKSVTWQSENEFRIVHELKVSEFPLVRFAAKPTMITRYIPLETPSWTARRSPILPIAKIIMGPGNDFAVSEVSLRLLLDQMGYPQIPISQSAISLRKL